MDLTDLLTLAVMLVVWYVLLAKVLPRFGVGT
jgi:hypothetical protein